MTRDGPAVNLHARCGLADAAREPLASAPMPRPSPRAARRGAFASASATLFATGTALGALATLTLACGGGERPKSAWESEDRVAANSAHESAAAASPATSATAAPSTVDEGPAETTLVADTTPEAKADALKREGGAVTRKECEQMIDRYVDLLVKSDDRLSALGPEAIAMAKGQAKGQKGDPCTDEKLTKKKYKCAMSAKTKEKWEKCVE